MDKNKSFFQLIWGVALLLAGIGIFFRIPHIMPKVKQFSSMSFFISFCFYLIGILLVGGGFKKIITIYKERKN